MKYIPSIATTLAKCVGCITTVLCTC